MSRSPEARDYYRTLEVPPEATEDEIRRAYRRLALRWHPDRNPGVAEAAERFTTISEAYAVLIDPARRREYDEVRRRGAAHEFRYRREELFRDLFADPRASAVFEELVREFERLGLRADRHLFRQTLFGGRAVVVGGVFVLSPLTPVLALARLARLALGGGRAAAPARPGPAEVRPASVRRRLVEAARWLWGLPAAPAPPAVGGEVTVPLRLSREEAERGGRHRVRLEHDGRTEELLVTIPPGIGPGTRLRLRGKGRTAAGRRGDAYLEVEIID